MGAAEWQRVCVFAPTRVSGRCVDRKGISCHYHLMGNQEEACSVTTGDEPQGQGLEKEGQRRSIRNGNKAWPQLTVFDCCRGDGAGLQL